MAVAAQPSASAAAQENVFQFKTPPHSIEAEQSVLGGLLLDNGAADRIADFLSGDHFYSDAHRLLYNAIMQLVADNKPADVVTVAEIGRAHV